MKIHKGDTVIIIAGKDKGKTGEVLKAIPKTNQVIVEGVNTKTKHQKNRQVQSQGQIISKDAPIDVSNVALVENNKPVRVGYKLAESGKAKDKIRISRQSGKQI